MGGGQRICILTSSPHPKSVAGDVTAPQNPQQVIAIRRTRRQQGAKYGPVPSPSKGTHVQAAPGSTKARHSRWQALPLPRSPSLSAGCGARGSSRPGGAPPFLPQLLVCVLPGPGGEGAASGLTPGGAEGGPRGGVRWRSRLPPPTRISRADPSSRGLFHARTARF